jgi:hypothetical protein
MLCRLTSLCLAQHYLFCTFKRQFKNKKNFNDQITGVLKKNHYSHKPIRGSSEVWITSICRLRTVPWLIELCIIPICRLRTVPRPFEIMPSIEDLRKIALKALFFNFWSLPESQCITGQFWKTEVAVLSDQVRLVACRNFDIFGWLSVIYSLKVDQLKQQK